MRSQLFLAFLMSFFTGGCFGNPRTLVVPLSKRDIAKAYPAVLEVDFNNFSNELKYEVLHYIKKSSEDNSFGLMQFEKIRKGLANREIDLEDALIIAVGIAKVEPTNFDSNELRMALRDQGHRKLSVQQLGRIIYGIYSRNIGKYKLVLKTGEVLNHRENNTIEKDKHQTNENTRRKTTKKNKVKVQESSVQADRNFDRVKDVKNFKTPGAETPRLEPTTSTPVNKPVQGTAFTSILEEAYEKIKEEIRTRKENESHKPQQITNIENEEDKKITNFKSTVTIPEDEIELINQIKRRIWEQTEQMKKNHYTTEKDSSNILKVEEEKKNEMKQSFQSVFTNNGNIRDRHEESEGDQDDSKRFENPSIFAGTVKKHGNRLSEGVYGSTKRKQQNAVKKVSNKVTNVQFPQFPLHQEITPPPAGIKGGWLQRNLRKIKNTFNVMSSGGKWVYHPLLSGVKGTSSSNIRPSSQGSTGTKFGSLGFVRKMFSNFIKNRFKS